MFFLRKRFVGREVAVNLAPEGWSVGADGALPRAAGGRECGPLIGR